MLNSGMIPPRNRDSFTGLYSAKQDQVKRFGHGRTRAGTAIVNSAAKLLKQCHTFF